MSRPTGNKNKKAALSKERDNCGTCKRRRYAEFMIPLLMPYPGHLHKKKTRYFCNTPECLPKNWENFVTQMPLPGLD
ncbi:hypothetical protein CJD36_003655 [Flavipsychrobacter stenotrophus]|uniref:Uncharacterized protein n=1 Tax=Flavipsychrobacter stenotrophus TaxID=2077091 RepID=A0A2S7T0X9_9BACT|nr:hypothetical protein [Flavipsychrobacter stenotrophus]PQJ12850.1 hypothetical protein CJD36_003655 [Flavipsychrobacter stenotrophus]